MNLRSKRELCDRFFLTWRLDSIASRSSEAQLGSPGSWLLPNANSIRSPPATRDFAVRPRVDLEPEGAADRRGGAIQWRSKQSAAARIAPVWVWCLAPAGSASAPSQRRRRIRVREAEERIKKTRAKPGRPDGPHARGPARRRATGRSPCSRSKPPFPFSFSASSHARVDFLVWECVKRQ
jgi:hypothetical protein